jgi:hypothetical protein
MEYFHFTFLTIKFQAKTPAVFRTKIIGFLIGTLYTMSLWAPSHLITQTITTGHQGLFLWQSARYLNGIDCKVVETLGRQTVADIEVEIGIPQWNIMERGFRHLVPAIFLFYETINKCTTPVS